MAFAPLRGAPGLAEKLPGLFAHVQQTQISFGKVDVHIQSHGDQSAVPPHERIEPEAPAGGLPHVSLLAKNLSDIAKSLRDGLGLADPDLPAQYQYSNYLIDPSHRPRFVHATYVFSP